LAEHEPEQPRSAEAEPSVEEVIEQVRALPVGHFLLTTVSTLASLTYAKLEAGDLEQARVGIEALSALVPVLEGEIEAATSRDLRAALANLQLAYADAAR
jgi:hypothetical protein